MKLQDIFNRFSHLFSEKQLPPIPPPGAENAPPPPPSPEAGVPVNPNMPGGEPDPAIAQPGVDGEMPPVPTPEDDPNTIEEPTPMTTDGEFDYVKAMARALTTELEPQEEREVDDLLGDMEIGRVKTDQGRVIRNRLDALIKKHHGERDLPEDEKPPSGL